MLAYKFITQIDSEGKIIVPDYLKNYYSNSVEIIMLFHENKIEIEDRISVFYNLIDKYNQIEEPELDSSELYKNKHHRNERHFDFN